MTRILAQKEYLGVILLKLDQEMKIFNLSDSNTITFLMIDVLPKGQYQ